MESNIILEMKGITKRFPGVLALDDVNLELKKGEVLALLGENGAGKSTLMKILSGAYTADKGGIILGGEKMEDYGPKKALDKGISIMYQELNYVKDLSIAENIFLNNLPMKAGNKIVDYKKLKQDAKKYMDEVGLCYDPFIEVAELSVAEKQLVEIAKAISHNIKVLVMDEPTSALNDKEIEILFGIIKKLSAQGKSIIYISHRLDEVFEISDRVMVMRDGKGVGNLKTSETNKAELVRFMVGREIKDMYPVEDRGFGEYALEVEDLSTDKVKDINIKVRKGEIVGLFGLMGAGRSNIVESIFGSADKKKGSIKVDGKQVKINTPEDAIKAGIGYVPSERKLAGLVLIHSVKHNVSLAFIDRLKDKLFLNLKKEKNLVEKWVEKLNVKTPSIENLVESLSGGNQQKVVLSKWMMTNPQVLILNEPTRGIDVGAKVEIYKLMEEFCKQGLGILMISSELPEVMAIADRTVTICEGRVTGEIVKSEYSQERLLLGAIGESVQQ